MSAVTRYFPEDKAFVGVDLPGICNRPLFCANTPTTLLSGDRPLLRLIRYGTLLGTLRFRVQTESGPRYLDECSSIRFRYRANLTEWYIQDPALPCAVTLAAGVPEDTEGFVLRAEAASAVELHWSYGGLYTFEECHWNLTPDDPEAIGCADTPAEWYAGNRLTCGDGVFTLRTDGGMEGTFVSGLGAQGGSVQRSIAGESAVHLRCSQSAAIRQDCSVGGTLQLGGEPAYIAVARTVPGECAALYASALRRHEQLAGIFDSCTPDPYLDAQMAAISAEIDGAWYGQYTVHSNQAWNAPYLGWCNRFGNALGGWFDRVLTEVEYYCGYINKTDVRTGGASDPALRHTEAAESSRFYGIGHVGQHQFMYNMQSQFFDQAIFAWRMTNDSRLAGLLRTALEYHTLWQDECFDPDNDGLYESYINTWPTDSVWYNGGGSCEETCYAYRAHTAAMELAAAAGDEACAARHRQRLELIRRGFFEKLWLKDAGYPAMYVEKGGHERAHRSAWLYNSFMPVDMDLTDPFEAAMCLDYPRWALENVQEPTGGRMIWMSNWVPSIWSVRKKTPGECLQQAYACFKAGFTQDGCELLTGSLRSYGFHQPVDPDSPSGAKPSAISSETASLLARAVVCGLHGYRPDYPNNKVELCPQYPADWDHATIATSYFCSSFRRDGNRLCYRFTLPQTADVIVRIPVGLSGITAVRGAAEWRLLPSFGGQFLQLMLSGVASGELEITLADALPSTDPLDIACAPGDAVSLPCTGVTAVYDPQQILSRSTVTDGTAVLNLRTDMDGAHMVFARCVYQTITYWQIVRLEISATAARLEQQARTQPQTDGGSFTTLPLADVLTDDVTAIYRQDYHVPRDHVHLSIGSDGFSPWTFAHWALPLPEIRLNCAGEKVVTPQGVPFLIGSESKNIAFTSLYPNWPAAVTVPVNRSARAAEVLVCGSTNPMQIGIANAVLRFSYADGTQDELELVNPDNYWQLAPYSGRPTEKGQDTVNDYSYESDAFCLPKTPPVTVQLGENCRAVALGYQLQPGKRLASITLETLSQEVVVGLMSVTLVDAEP